MARGQWTEVEARAPVGHIAQERQSVQAYAQERGIVPQRLRWWSRRLRATRRRSGRRGCRALVTHDVGGRSYSSCRCGAEPPFSRSVSLCGGEPKRHTMTSTRGEERGQRDEVPRMHEAVACELLRYPVQSFLKSAQPPTVNPIERATGMNMASDENVRRDESDTGASPYLPGRLLVVSVVQNANQDARSPPIRMARTSPSLAVRRNLKK